MEGIKAATDSKISHVLNKEQQIVTSAKEQTLRRMDSYSFVII